ncbi:polyphosphate kinase 2 family protein [Paraburkholderia saeva]|uniref:hypothetical protein n=1 Tax=Paraburkholderia saeva TaxID=2777537 RepID=UPI003899F3DC
MSRRDTRSSATSIPRHLNAKHDFLWRTTRDLPTGGQIGIFNRSSCEKVLIVCLHPEMLPREALPDVPLDREAVWHDLCRSIADLARGVRYRI